MRQQTKPFIVEIKQSRKLKSGDRKTSIWGKLDLKPETEPQGEASMAERSPALAGDDRS